MSCPSCGRELPGTFPYCPFCGAAVTGAADGQRREERKVVSVLFADLVGSSATPGCGFGPVRKGQ
jgi:hypothetical protein